MASLGEARNYHLDWGLAFTRAKRRKAKSEARRKVFRNRKGQRQLHGKERTASLHKRQQKGLHSTETDASRVGSGALAFSFCEQRQTTTVTSSLRNVDAVVVVVFCSFWMHCDQFGMRTRVTSSLLRLTGRAISCATMFISFRFAAFSSSSCFSVLSSFVRIWLCGETTQRMSEYLFREVAEGRQ